MKRRLRFLLYRYQRFLRLQGGEDHDHFSATHKHRAAEELVEIFRFLSRTELDLCQMVGRQFQRIVDGYAHRLAVRAFNEIHLCKRLRQPADQKQTTFARFSFADGTTRTRELGNGKHAFRFLLCCFRNSVALLFRSDVVITEKEAELWRETHARWEQRNVLNFALVEMDVPLMAEAADAVVAIWDKWKGIVDGRLQTLSLRLEPTLEKGGSRYDFHSRTHSASMPEKTFVSASPLMKKYGFPSRNRSGGPVAERLKLRFCSPSKGGVDKFIETFLALDDAACVPMEIVVCFAEQRHTGFLNYAEQQRLFWDACDDQALLDPRQPEHYRNVRAYEPILNVKSGRSLCLILQNRYLLSGYVYPSSDLAYPPPNQNSVNLVIVSDEWSYHSRAEYERKDRPACAPSKPKSSGHARTVVGTPTL